MSSKIFKNCKRPFIPKIFIFSLIFTNLSGCFQDNHKIEDDEALANFEYSPKQLFDPAFLNLAKQMKRCKHINIEKDPFTLNGTQGTYFQNDPNENITEDNLGDFDIGTLKMIGSIAQRNQWWGLIKTPNRTVHTVNVGQLLDHDFYLVTEITSDEIYLLNIHLKSFEHSTQVKVLELNSIK